MGKVKLLRWLGVFLVVVCAAGFLTVADDLRHIGEIIGVGLIGVAGVVLIIVARRG